MNGFRWADGLVLPIKKILVFLGLLFVPITQASADTLEIGKFTLGIFSSIVVHELGHATAVEATGGNVNKIELFQNGVLSGATYYNPASNSKGENQLISASGVVATSLATEVIIRNQSLHDNSFAQGMLAFNLLSNISYVKNFYTKRLGENGWQGNDIDVYESYGGNANLLNALLVAHTVSTMIRILSLSLNKTYLVYRFSFSKKELTLQYSTCCIKI